MRPRTKVRGVQRLPFPDLYTHRTHSTKTMLRSGFVIENDAAFPFLAGNHEE